MEPITLEQFDRLHEADASLENLESIRAALKSREDMVKVVERCSTMKTMLETGATREFPDGKTSEDDQGGLAIGLAISRKENVVILDFGPDLGWVAFEPEKACLFADEVINKAKQLTGEGL